MSDAGAPAGDTAREEIEAVARAIADADGSEAWGAYMDMARAALDRVRADSARGEDHEAGIEAAVLEVMSSPSYATATPAMRARWIANHVRAALTRPSPVDDTVRLREALVEVRDVAANNHIGALAACMQIHKIAADALSLSIPGSRRRTMSGESRLMSRNPYYCIHGAPLDRRCEACATAPDPVDDAAVEAVDQAIAALHDRTDLHSRAIEEARKAARAAITAYLDRSGLAEAESEIKAMFAETETRLIAKVDELGGKLAEARASLERAQKSFAWNEDRRLEAVARAEAAEGKASLWYDACAHQVVRAEKAERERDELRERLDQTSAGPSSET